MRVVITGACGFIGKHMVKELLRNGYEVLPVDIKNKTPIDFTASNFKHYLQQGDKVLHLGAVANFRDAEVNPQLAVRTNVEGTLNIIKACIEKKVERLVHASTGSVFDVSCPKPVKENALRNPSSIYGLCVGGRTYIITKLGLKQIMFVKPIEDCVLSKDGKWHRILSVIRRPLAREEKIVKFVPSRGLPFLVTVSHLVLTRKGWQEVQNVRQYRPGYTNNTMIIEPEPTFEGTSIPELLEFNYRGYHSDIMCDEAFWRLVGFWLADGTLESTTGPWACPNYISISQKKAPTLEKYLPRCKQIDPEAKIYSMKKINKLSFWHPGLWRWLKDNFTAGTIEKKEEQKRKVIRRKNIPLWLAELPDGQFNEFWNGWYEGDGLKRPSLGMKAQQVSTESPFVAGRMYLILRMRGINCSLKKYHHPNGKDYFKVSWLASTYQNNCKIIPTMPYTNMFVYDLEVEGEDSYCLPGCVMHNSKKQAEDWIFQYGEMKRDTYGKLSYIILRYPYIYGVGKDWGAIGAFIKRIKNNQPPIILGGNQTNDFLYIKDVVAATILALESPHLNQVYNIGSGQEVTIKTTAQLCLEMLDSKLQIEYHKARSFDPTRFIYDSSHTQKLLGFKAKWNLKDGLKDMLQKGCKE